MDGFRSAKCGIGNFLLAEGNTLQRRRLDAALANDQIAWIVKSMLPANTFILLGPTAVGKSDLAVQLAERMGGEIVGADAFQIYQGLDILSAKPSRELRTRVPHH